tara:strand:+ start:66 stop:554 length:489 start_codon:yes stop_codon:yes gene_type:complete
MPCSKIDRLPEEFVVKLKILLAENKGNKTQVGERIGIDRSTLRKVLRGGNISLKGFKKIQDFFDRKASDSSIDDIVGSINITGKEKSCISSKRLQMLFTQFKISADSLNACMAEFANADIGSRRRLHELCGKELTDTFTLIRALSSESMLQTVKKETGKDTF